MRSFYIAGELVTVSPNWNISSKLNQRTTMSMTVVNIGNLPEISEGDSVVVYNNTDKIFAGIIYSVRAYETDEIVREINYDIQIVDNSAIADKRLIAQVAENKTAGDIVKDYILPILADEGITAGIIQNGSTITKAVFNYIQCSAALDYLKDITGFNWKIDNDKRLHFFSRETNAAPFTLNNLIPHDGFEKNSTMDNYRNKQYIRGSQGETAVQTKEKPSPKPDGESRTFTTRFPLAKKPIIFINSVQVSDSDVGINGLDTGKKWYFAYNSNTITQDTSETPLTSIDILEITYVGLRNLFVKIENATGIDDRKIKETGTSGIYENITNEATIQTTKQALEYGNGLIQKYGEISDTISFITTIGGLEAGQLLEVVKPLFNIKDNFLIESVNISGWDADKIEYQVTALDGASIGGWEQFFKKLINNNKTFNISENEVIITLHTFNENEKYNGQVEVKIFNVLYPSETLYPSDNLYPNRIATTQNIYD